MKNEKNHSDTLGEEIEEVIRKLEGEKQTGELDREHVLEVLKHARSRLATAAEKDNIYRLVADHAHNLGYLLSGDGERILYITPSCRRITGYQPEEFYKNPRLMTEIINPEDFSLINKKKNQAFAKAEFRIIRKDGEIRWIAYNSHKIYDEEGTYAGIRVSNRDITDQKQAEEKLREAEQKLRDIIEHSTNLFYSHTPDHQLTFISPQSIQFFGYNSEVAAMKWTQLLTDHPANKKGYEFTQRAIDTGQKQPPYELQLKKKNGDTFWVEVNEAPVVKEGKTVSVVGALTDITDRKEVYELLSKSLQEKEVLLTEIHHRVKNNMAVISGMLSLEAEQQHDPRVKNPLLKSESRIRSMALIHDQLYQHESFAEIEFGSYMRELTDRIYEHYLSEETTIHIDIDAEEVFMDITSAVPCGLLLNELLTNGFKHAFPYRPEGKIRLGLHNKKRNIMLRYEDNGAGLPDAVRNEINSGQSRSLGMNLINGLTQQLGGTITADNRDGTILEVSFAV